MLFIILLGVKIKFHKVKEIQALSGKFKNEEEKKNYLMENVVQMSCDVFFTTHSEVVLLDGNRSIFGINDMIPLVN